MADAQPDVQHKEVDVPGSHTPNDRKNSVNGYSVPRQTDRYGFFGGNQFTDPEE